MRSGWNGEAWRPALPAVALLLGCSSAAPQPATPGPEGGTLGTAEGGGDAAAIRAACGEGDAAACALLGDLLYRGDRIEEAAEALAQACDGGDVPACCRREAMLFEQEFQADDASPAAVRACRAACDAGDPDGCHRLATFLGYHGGDPAPATAAYLRACDAGAFESCADLLARATRSAPTKDEARAPFRTACDAGDAPRCFALGRSLLGDHRDEEALGPLDRGCMSCSYRDGPGAEGAYWPAALDGHAYGFWSSSVAPDAAGDAWTVDFEDGRVWTDDRTSPEAHLRVRCVRGGLAAPTGGAT
jgi:hypothetical protein